MIPQQATLKFSEAERPFGERLLKIAFEIDRIEGYSEPHAMTVARLSENVGAQMGIHGGDLIALKFAALVHDIGERVMKRNYLLRPGPLTWEETLDLWRHPILGEQAAGELRLSRQSQLLVRWHHEWWNGLGYPDGLAGEMIPLGARVLRVVDSYCAMISNRPHRLRFDPREAEQIIADLAGIEFDPQVVKLLLAILAEERRGREAEARSHAAQVERRVTLRPEGAQNPPPTLAPTPAPTPPTPPTPADKRPQPAADAVEIPPTDVAPDMEARPQLVEPKIETAEQIDITIRHETP